MQIIEKNIDSKLLRIIVINTNNKSLACIKELIKKKCIYFDYIVIFNDDRRYNDNNVLLYTNSFTRILTQKSKSYYSYQAIIIDYMKSDTYKNYLRSKKFERIMAY